MKPLMRFLVIGALVVAYIFYMSPTHAASPLSATVELSVPLELGKSTELSVTLLRDGKVVPPSALKTVHTRQLHLLVIDQSFEDYQHLHPQVDAKGVWHARFMPRHKGLYHVWADVTPQAGDHQYIMSDIGDPLPTPPHIDKETKTDVKISGHRFALRFDEAPKPGQAAMGHIMVTDADGNPVKALEPIMGAYGHIVGFTANGKEVLHVHPVGDEPTKPSDRSGPELLFHLEPKHPGLLKLFAQLRIGNKDIFVPFTITVMP